jgi:hypothetical protein
MSPSTCCFADWTGAGLQETSPIFQESFEDFLYKLDSLRREKVVGIPRRRTSILGVDPISGLPASSLVTGMVLPSLRVSEPIVQPKPKRRLSRKNTF